MKSLFVKWILIIAVMSGVGVVNATPISVVEFTSVNGPNVAADVEALGVSGFNLARSSVTQTGGGTFNSNNWQLGGSKALALASNKAIFWGFSSTLGYDLTSISFGYDRSNTGPSSIAIDLFINGVSQGEIFSDTSVNTNSSETALIDLSAFTNVTNPFFRLSGWNATGTNGTFDIENRSALGGKGIVITGSLTAVPGPSTIAIFGLSLIGLAFARRKQS